jgi:signal transduction histidine kinase
MARRTLLITYIATYLLAVGGITRILVRFRDDRLWSIAILSGVYLVLLILEPFLIRQNRLLTYTYLIIQTAIIATLSLLTPNADFWAVLFCPLVVQVMHNFPRRTGFLITGIFTVITSILLLLSLDSEVGIPLIFVYAVIYFLLAAFIAIIREAEAARQQSQQQQAELQTAYQQLQTYTAQAEELAVLQERNRLARELHDSVTQSLHSSTLLAEAGQRVASTGDIERARGYLIRLGEISQQALREMRLLVYELRPLALSGIGLEAALQQRLDTVERRSGVEVELSVEEDLDIPARVEEELYRIAMEALNNALKHANPTKVTVDLSKEEKREIPCIALSIMDDGIGFDLDSKVEAGGLGLVSMQERIEKLGGDLTIISAPGEGTQVKACVNLKTPKQSPSAQEV